MGTAKYPYPADDPALISDSIHSLRSWQVTLDDSGTAVQAVRNELAAQWSGVASDAAQTHISKGETAFRDGKDTVCTVIQALEVYRDCVLQARLEIDTIRADDTALGPSYAALQAAIFSPSTVTEQQRIDASALVELLGAGNAPGQRYAAVRERVDDAVARVSGVLERNPFAQSDFPVPSPSPGPSPYPPWARRELEMVAPRDRATTDALEQSWEWTAEMIAGDMRRNPEIFDDLMNPTPIPSWLYFGLGGDHVARLALFGYLVRSGGPWDHKSRIVAHIHEELGRRVTVEETYLPVPGHSGLNLSQDVWSNIHYGFVGRNVGLSEFELTQAQKGYGTFDQGDMISIRIGYELAKKYKPEEITAEIVQQAILDHMDEYEDACTDPNGGASQLRKGE